MPANQLLEKLVSGGQTGVDRAALDVAIEIGLPLGGWCPKTRKAEDGSLSYIYPLVETPSEDYAERTEWNVRDSDGTLILVRGPVLKTGTLMTREFAVRYQKPHLVVNLDNNPDVNQIRDWIKTTRIKTLNIAGPRESLAPGIYEQVKSLLRHLFTEQCTE